MVFKAECVSGVLSSLFEECFSMQVISCFSSVINLAHNDLIVSIQNRDIPLTPMAAVFSSEDFTQLRKFLKPNQMLAFRSGQLSMDGVCIDLTEADVFSSELSSMELQPGASILGILSGAAKLFAKQGSLMPLVLPACGSSNDEEYVALAQHVLSEGSFHRLVGLGPGLTPSGDDFLVGMLVGLQITASPGRAELIRLLEEQLHLTNQISAAFLRHAVDGHFSAPILQLIAAMKAGEREEVVTAAAHLSSIGHSSGSDMLAGLLYVLIHPDCCQQIS